jgi:MYXO-CTERM domain-containing protein
VEVKYGGSLGFHLGVYAEEGGLDYQLAVLGDRFPTGAPIKLRALTGFSGIPLVQGDSKQASHAGMLAGPSALSGSQFINRIDSADPHTTTRIPLDLPHALPANVSFVVKAEAPQEALGEFLHAAKDGPANKSLDPDLSATPYEKKIASLQQEVRKVAALKAIPIAAEMKQVGPGVFEYVHSDTKIPGPYRFTVTMTIKDASGKVVLERTESADAVVEAIPNIQQTSVVHTYDAEDSAHVFVIEPKDKFGTRLGPGWDNFFRVSIDDPKARSSFTNPNANGEYVLKVLGLGATESPFVKIDYGGKTFVQAPLQRLGKEADSCPACPTCTCSYQSDAPPIRRLDGIFIVLLALVGVFALRRRRSRT